MIHRTTLRRVIPGIARAAGIALVLTSASLLACSDHSGHDHGATSDEAVRSAIQAHIDAAGRTLEVEDPTRDRAAVTLAFDHVHERVKDTSGGRRLACVDFEAADGTVYDVDYYVRASDGGGEPVVEDVVLHKVEGENVLAPERQQELDRAGS